MYEVWPLQPFAIIWEGETLPALLPFKTLLLDFFTPCPFGSLPSIFLNTQFVGNELREIKINCTSVRI